MIRRFCDVCENELTKYNAILSNNGRMSTTAGGGRDQALHIEVTTGLQGIWNTGDFCKYCVIDAVLKLDDRPTARRSLSG